MTKTDFGYCDVLIGLQYGDEGKAKIVDYLAPRYDVVARFNGGVNAGHTIVTDRGKLALRQVPSAVAYEGQLMYIGSGCALSVADLQKELQSIADIGYSVSGRLFISPNSSLVLPHHIVLDKLHGAHVGTTGNGIGPAYADRAFRMRDGMITNIRARDLKADPTGVIRAAEKLLNQLEVEDSYREIGHQALERFRAAVEQVCGFVLESPTFLAEKVASGAKVIFEGAQSYMLDVVAGDVPYVTSSHTSVAAAYSGGDVPPKFHRYAFGVAKLIMSRVGNGPFPSEFGGERSREYCTKDEGLAHTR
ncbi:MAG: adenylosuccinate synthetase, partial [Bdellovibrionales bacterium]|nr:adenylosuccinate synthetase [Bdellovibrionales bacterium]